MDLKNRVLGAGHRIFTVIGGVAGFLVAVGQYMSYIPEPYRSSKWYAVAAAIVALGAAIKMPGQDAKNKTETPVPQPSVPPVNPALILLLGASLLLPVAAYGDDAPPPPAPAPVHKLCVGNFCGQAGVGVTGGAYDFEKKQFLRNYTVGGLLQITHIAIKDFAFVGGIGFQAGEIIGMPVQVGLEYLPLKVALVYCDNTLFGVGEAPSRTLTGGYVITF